MTNLKTTNALAASLLVIALNSSIPNIAFAGGTAGGDNAATSTTTGDASTPMGDRQDDDHDYGWIGLLGLLGLLGLKRRDHDHKL